MAIKGIASVNNPFIDGINIPDELFCDRKEETREIISLLNNGSKVVLKAPRRIGKSSLITHILNQKEIRDNYNTIYLDLFGTNTAEEFIRDFQRAFTSEEFTRLETAKEIIKSLPEKISLEAEYDLLESKVKSRLSFKDFRKITLSLDTIFAFLENTKKPTIVVFDEFQQVKYYPEPMAAILRGYIQKATNTRFLFSGSSRRMLSTMFDSYGEPFYHSAESIDLSIISETKYEEFCKKNFSDYNKDIDPTAIEFAYELAAGNTYEIQRIMRNVFISTAEGGTASVDNIKETINKILARQDQTYREKLSMLNNTKERKVFIAIALEGVATKLMSQKKIQEYKLGAVSSISQSLDNLCNENGFNLVLKIGQSYILQDKMFELWIAKQYDLLEEKFATAKQQFVAETECTKEIDLPKFPKLTCSPA